MDITKITDEIIPEKLSEIERREGVRILHAVESGSRAWGFASPDSDFDVRFIYVREEDYYLRLNEGRDVIEWQLDDTLDINGWDLRKALMLLHKSNPTVFEWSMSPIVYKTTDEWLKVGGIVGEYFRPKTGVYHYLNMARRNYREYLSGERVKLKKYFYVLRPALACKWILKKGCPPPVLFAELAEECLDEGVRDEVRALLALKTAAPELGEGERIGRLNDYLDDSITAIEKALEDYPKDSNHDWDRLNSVFLDIVKA